MASASLKDLQQRYRALPIALNRHASKRVNFDFSQLYPDTLVIQTLTEQIDDLTI